MAFITVPIELEGLLAVMAGAAIFTFSVGNFTNLGRICFHVEIELGMADTAGVFCPVLPVREYDRQDAVSCGVAIYDDVAKLLRRRERRQIKGFTAPYARCTEDQPQQQESYPYH